MESLLAEIELFCARHGLSETTFGRLVRDRHIVRQLRDGRRMWPATVERIRERMAALDAERRPAPSRTVLCCVCERRLDAGTARSCRVEDCPQAGRAAA